MQTDIHLEMNFCRRCGHALQATTPLVFGCDNGHTLFLNASPASAVVLLNEADEVLVLRRNIAPHKGALDLPGGFCDGPEPADQAMMRELTEECRITPEQYSPLEYVCTAIDPYEYGGETLPVHVTIFTARTKGLLRPQLDHENSFAEYIPIADVPIDEIPFPSLRKGLEIMKKRLSA